MPYTAEPVWWDWSLIVGDTAQPATFVLQDADEVAYDLTGVTGVCQVRAEPGGTLLFTPTVTITDAAAGEFTFVAAANGALLPQRARYSVRLTWPDTTVRTVLVGAVTIVESVVA